jgi:hypothetical protein
LRVTGLGAGLSAGLARWRAPRAVHDPGKILADLVVTLALGGDCLSDVAMLCRAAGRPVASDPVISRLVSALTAEGQPRALRAIRKARAAARERTWALPASARRAATGALTTVDVDATIVTAHSPAQTTGRTDLEEDVRFHPLAAFANHGTGAGGKARAVRLRPGNAGSNTAAERRQDRRLPYPDLRTLLSRLPPETDRHYEPAKLLNLTPATPKARFATIDSLICRREGRRL